MPHALDAGPRPEEQTAGNDGRQIAAAEFVLRLRARGIAGLDLLRTLEQVPRQAFVPHRYADLATRDVALPIGCGQTMPEPYFLARMIEALDLEPHHRVLEIGTGSGYVTAVLSRLAGEVLSIDRFQSLVIGARTRLDQLAIGNAAVVWEDGFTFKPPGPFDRILIEALVEDIAPQWLDSLAPRGVLVLGRSSAPSPSRGRRSQHLVRVSADGCGGFFEEPLVASRLQPLNPGTSRAL